MIRHAFLKAKNSIIASPLPFLFLFSMRAGVSIYSDNLMASNFKNPPFFFLILLFLTDILLHFFVVYFAAGKKLFFPFFQALGYFFAFSLFYFLRILIGMILLVFPGIYIFSFEFFTPYILYLSPDSEDIFKDSRSLVSQYKKELLPWEFVYVFLGAISFFFSGDSHLSILIMVVLDFLSSAMDVFFYHIICSLLGKGPKTS